MKGKRRTFPRDKSRPAAIRGRRRGPRGVAPPRAEREASEPFALASLPFDLYQRHKLLQEVIGRIRGRRKRLTILDVGGSGGHLRQFLPRDRVMALDQEGGGDGVELLADGRRLPFADGAFDVVVSADTLEHVTSRRRPALLRELARVSGDAVVLTAPFAGAQNEEAESILEGFLRHRLKIDHRFLTEHRLHGLPDRRRAEKTLAREVGPVVAVPNGCLDRWLLMMGLSFYLDLDPSLEDMKRQVNAYYNRNYYRTDNAEPAYRHLLVARRPPARPLHTEGLVAAAGEPARVDFSPINALIEVTGIDLLKEAYRSIETLQERLADKDLNAARLQAEKEQRQRVIDSLQQEVQRRHQGLEELRGSLSEVQEALKDRSRRVVELGRTLEKREAEIARLAGEVRSGADADRADLSHEVDQRRAAQALLEAQRDGLHQQVRDRDAQIAEMERQLAREERSLDRLQGQLDKILAHSGNLESILERREDHLGGLAAHASNLEKLLSRRQDHTEELAAAARELERQEGDLGAVKRQAADLEELLRESKEEARRLTGELASQGGRLSEVGEHSRALEAQLEARQRQATELESRAAALQSELDRGEFRRRELADSLEHWRRRAAEVEEHAAGLEAARDRALQDATSLRPLLESRNRRIAELGEHARGLEERDRRLFQQVSLLQKVVDTRQQTIAEVNAQAERLRSDAETLRAELRGTRLALRQVTEEGAARRQEMDRLAERLQQERGTASRLRDDLEVSETRFVERDRAAQEQAARVEDGRAVMARQHEEIEEQTRRLTELEGEVGELRRDTRRQRRATEQLQAELREARTRLEESRATLEDRSRQARRLAEQLQELHGRGIVRLLRKVRLLPDPE